MKLGCHLAALLFLIAPASPTQAGEVLRAFFTSGPQGNEREPIDTLRTAGTSRSGVYFYSEIQGMRGDRIIHRWEHAGSVVFEVPFRVRSDRWSAYSYKRLDPSLGGRWTVTILDDQGSVLASESLDFASTPAPPAPISDPSPMAEPVEPVPVDPMPRETAMPEPEPPVAEPETSMPEPSIAEPEPEPSKPEPSMAAPEPPVAEESKPDSPVVEPEAERPAEAQPITVPPPGVQRPRLGARGDPDRAWKDRSGTPR